MPQPKMADKVTSQSSVKERLPNLLLGNNRTKRNALHPINFVGELKQWANFEQDVITEFQNHIWSSKRVLDYKPHGFLPLPSQRNEHVAVGDETGVQGRWQEHVGQVMSSVFLDKGLDLTLGDFRASCSTYSKRPDVACIAHVQHVQSWHDNPPLPAQQVPHDLLFVGELKTPWITEHSLSQGIDNSKSFRHILGQIAQYMKDLNLKYGFMATYNETVFLRQEKDGVTGKWELQYSPVIMHSTSGTSKTASLRQCIWYMARCAEAQRHVTNDTRRQLWVVRLRDEA
ncbi:hypothetical protein BDV33DRAFT_199232 [Aspergillus novoparasiticus]|uniref:Fungal-type protein kinase domain-containing protein n=1 Tax=Aspergillus novoparasiticus TaxID=986946 RepID=A0A5N6F506_9EURO|nr:hypothetical protein BDV33DRAFT_199232 [Aspergillus novoparasiticus]